jgi:hypothetical protein
MEWANLRSAVLRARSRMAKHLYVSTYCQHDRHQSCRLQCKLCQAPCLCPCHDPVDDGGADGNARTPISR